MNREVETIREKVHTTADAALFLCFQEVKGSHSKGVIRLPLLHYDIPFARHAGCRKLYAEPFRRGKRRVGIYR